MKAIRPSRFHADDRSARPRVRGIAIHGVFSGAYLNGIDAKQRLSVPAPIRETVEQQSLQRAIVLAPAEHAPCLVGYDLTHFARLQAELQARFAGDFGPARSQKARNIFGMADTLRYDDNGRIVLTAILRDLGALGSQALFLGAGDYFELWDPALLLAEPDQDIRLIRTVKALMAQRNPA